jgi:hypothetical protein
MYARDEWSDPSLAKVVLWQQTIRSGGGCNSGGDGSRSITAGNDHWRVEGDSEASNNNCDARTENKKEKSVVVAELANVVVCGNDGVITAGKPDNGLVLLSAFGPQIPLHRNIGPRFFDNRAKVTMSGAGSLQPPNVEAAILMTQLFAVGYYHFLLELVPRLLIAKQYARSAPLLVPSDGDRIHGFIKHILAILGYSEGMIVKYPVAPTGAPAGFAKVRVQRLITVDWVPHPSSVRVDDAHLPPKYALNLVRDALQSPIALHPQTQQQPMVIWIQRARAPSRRITNDGELVALVKSRLPANAVLQIFSDDPCPTAAQGFELFSRAAVVIGLHGAGLANAVLMMAGGHLVEFALPEPHAQYYAHLADANDLVYHKVQLNGTGLYSEVSITIPPAALSLALDNIPLLSEG